MNAIPEIKTRTDRCDRHGEFIARNWLRNVWSKCPACTAEHEAQERERAESADRQARLAAWEQRIGGSGIPERFRDRTLDTFRAETPDQVHALELAREYALGFDTCAAKTGRSLIFIGRVGTGKTHLAAGIALHLMAQRRSVLFTTVQRAIRRVRDTWRRDSTETESHAVGTLVQPDLLILDEVGIQSGTEAERNLLFDILNERYERRRPCILLSNLALDDVRAFLGERIFDRLREDGGQAVPFDWDSHRGRA